MLKAPTPKASTSRVRIAAHTGWIVSVLSILSFPHKKTYMSARHSCCKCLSCADPLTVQPLPHVDSRTSLTCSGHSRLKQFLRLLWKLHAATGKQVSGASAASRGKWQTQTHMSKHKYIYIYIYTYIFAHIHIHIHMFLYMDLGYRRLT